jgi:molybdopterin-containing oxidoreductase family iron-sulfur binding subunit
MTITRKQFLMFAAASLAGAAGAKVVSGAEVVRQIGKNDGKRWAMAVDFQKCRWDQGCTQCSAACNRTHNVPDIPNKAQEVKWIWKEKYQTVFRQESEVVNPALTSHPLSLLCNHCSKPACTKVCPTGATWKREEDGVVMMDWHRCIGCRYCMAACPYGSRSFNFVDPRPYVANVNPEFPTRTRGVVEKCNFCEERLAKGQMPVCVENCSERALTFGDQNDANSDIRRLLASRYAIQRQPELGTGPAIYYLI